MSVIVRFCHTELNELGKDVKVCSLEITVPEEIAGKSSSIQDYIAVSGNNEMEISLTISPDEVEFIKDAIEIESRINEATQEEREELIKGEFMKELSEEMKSTPFSALEILNYFYDFIGYDCRNIMKILAIARLNVGDYANFNTLIDWLARPVDRECNNDITDVDIKKVVLNSVFQYTDYNNTYTATMGTSAEPRLDRSQTFECLTRNYFAAHENENDRAYFAEMIRCHDLRQYDWSDEVLLTKYTNGDLLANLFEKFPFLDGVFISPDIHLVDVLNSSDRGDQLKIFVGTGSRGLKSSKNDISLFVKLLNVLPKAANRYSYSLVGTILRYHITIDRRIIEILIIMGYTTKYSVLDNLSYVKEQIMYDSTGLTVTYPFLRAMKEDVNYATHIETRNQEDEIDREVAGRVGRSRNARDPLRERHSRRELMDTRNILLPFFDQNVGASIDIMRANRDLDSITDMVANYTIKYFSPYTFGLIPLFPVEYIHEYYQITKKSDSWKDLPWKRSQIEYGVIISITEFATDIKTTRGLVKRLSSKTFALDTQVGDIVIISSEDNGKTQHLISNVSRV